MQDKIFKVKVFKVTYKSVKSVKVFSALKYLGYMVLGYFLYYYTEILLYIKILQLQLTCRINCTQSSDLTTSLYSTEKTIQNHSYKEVYEHVRLMGLATSKQVMLISVGNI